MHLSHRSMLRLFGLSICLLLLGLQSTMQLTDSDIERYRYKMINRNHFSPTWI